MPRMLYIADKRKARAIPQRSEIKWTTRCLPEEEGKRGELLDCQANFVEKNPYETRNTNLISLDVATKL